MEKIIMKAKENKMEKPLLIVETKGYCELVIQGNGCKHCSVSKYEDPGGTTNGVDWSDVIAQFSEVNESGHVVLKNGAGALGKQELSLLEHALENGLSTTVTTEGICVPTEFEKKLHELADKYQDQVGVTVSLDGPTSEVYGQLRKSDHFDQVVNFIKKSVEKGLDVAVNYVVHAGNVKQIPEYVDQVVNELGVNRVNFLELNMTGSAIKNDLQVAKPEEYFKALMTSYAEGGENVRSALRGTFASAIEKYLEGSAGCKGCPAGSKGFAHVNVEGDIYPCSSLELPQYKAGNIKDTSLEDAMSSQEFQYAQKVAESAKTGSPIVSMCPGRLESFGESGRLDEATRLTKLISTYLESKGVEITEVKQPINACFNPAF